VRIVVDIESFYQVVDNQQLLVITKADASAVQTIVRIYAALTLRCTYMLDFSTLVHLSAPDMVDLQVLKYGMQVIAFYSTNVTYITPDSSSNINISSPLPVNRTLHGMTPPPSQLSFQFLLHNASSVPEGHGLRIQISTQVIPKFIPFFSK
jgi:hypothetical protein